MQKFYQPVGKVDVGGAGFGGGVFFEEVIDFEVEVWEVGSAAEPVTNKFTNTFWFFIMNSPILHFRLKR